MASTLPLPPHVELSGEAGLVAGVFVLAASVLAGAAALARRSGPSTSSSSRALGKRPRMAKSQLLAVLADSASVMEGAHLTALETVAAVERREAMRARMGGGERAEPMPLSQLSGIVDGAVRTKTAELLARHGVSEEDVEAALAAYSRTDAAVAKAERAVLEAHPLYAPRATILKAQRAIADAEVEVHRQAVAAAQAEGVELTGREFGQILVAHLAAAGGKDKSAAGNGSAPSLSEPILERLGLGDKAPLWTYVISQSMVEEAAEGGGDAAPFKRAFFGIMDRQKAELRALGLSVK
jgi:hypothetical protein